MGRLEGKVAIVTGGSKGIGEATVKRFLEEGAKVVFTSRTESEGKALEAALNTPNVKYVCADASKEEQWDAVIAAAEAYGPINILVNNAGMCQAMPIDFCSVEDFQKHYENNVLSAFLGIKKVHESMKRAGGGSIVNLSSQSGFIGGAGVPAYTAAKFAVRGLTKAAAVEFGPDKIRVNSVHPGVTLTPLTSAPDILPYTMAAADVACLGKVGEAVEQANLILYLASDESTYCSGSEFIADGGTICK